MDLQAYFARINYIDDTAATLDNLRRIHRAHLMHIPFENLNLHMPRPVILEEELLFRKFVEEHRGGFCYEQNGLFHALLTQLGYEVYRLEANVRAEDDTYAPPMTHMCLLVVIDGRRYLADVGFGAGFIEPLELDNPDTQVQDVGRFRIQSDGDTLYYWHQGIGAEEMKIGYRFYLAPHQLTDYIDACHYTQTSPKSHFTQRRVCSQWTERGRVTLTDDKLIFTTWDAERSETPIADEEHFHQLLREHFGITVQTHPPQVNSTAAE